MDYTKERQIAIEAVTQASMLCNAVRTEMVGVDSLIKGDRSPVTIADFGSQALICHYLTMAFSHDSVVGEENSAALQAPENAAMLAQVTQYVRRFYPHVTQDVVCRWIDAGNGALEERFWTLDPIDGTKGFLRNDQYAIALALVEQGQVNVAALACPALPSDLDDPTGETGVLFVAVRGGGAEMAPLNATDATLVSIHVTEPSDEAQWRFVESVESSHGNPVLQETVARAVGFTQPPLKMDSQAKYGAVARGDAALYLRLPSPKSPGYREKIWDHTAGKLIVEEAGGCVTDMYGTPLDLASDYRMYNNQGVVVSNGTLHTAVLEALCENK